MMKKYLKVVSVLLISLTTFLFSSGSVYAAGQDYDYDQQTITIKLQEREGSDSKVPIHSMGGTNGQIKQNAGMLPKTGEILGTPLYIFGLLLIALTTALIFYKEKRKRANT